VAGGVQQNARLEAAAAAEGITRADEPHLDRVLGHTLTLPCAAPGYVSLGLCVAPRLRLTRYRSEEGLWRGPGRDRLQGARRGVVVAEPARPRDRGEPVGAAWPVPL
jgi:hypothetical protein